MLISRVQVEEGFLDGLDLQFKPGLNVIIGARGTGKTSVIELIRFALGAESFTPTAAKTSLEHALAVLGSGRVRVTLDSNGNDFVVARSASDNPEAAALREPPLIFSQTEIESLGLHASGRLKLVDGFIESPPSAQSEETEVISIKSINRDVAARRHEILEYRQELEVLPVLEAELKALTPKEEEISKASQEAAEKSEALGKITEQLGRLGVAKDDADRIKASLTRRRQLLLSVLENWGEDSPRGTKSDVFDKALETASKAYDQIKASAENLSVSLAGLDDLKAKIEEKTSAQEQQARELRISIDKITEGAGRIANQGQSLRSRITRLASLRDVVAERERSIKDVIAKRSAALERLEQLRELRFEARQNVANDLNERLGPKIKVSVERSGLTDPYAAVIANLLRGSGLHYNELSRVIAEAVSPRELGEYAEQGDAEAFASAAGIPRDRAEKCLAVFSDPGTLDLLFTLQVEDRVDFYLLDQSTHKPISQLSTGQRCTVVLPIVLERRRRVLIVDQPEDHIDNAFIADTLIRAIIDRSSEDQVILSTHNANIPVLGDAAQVTQMASDGRRGFVVVAAALDDPAAVNAITSIMEGGRDAFRQRAQFYDQHP